MKCATPEQGPFFLAKMFVYDQHVMCELANISQSKHATTRYFIDIIRMQIKRILLLWVFTFFLLICNEILNQHISIHCKSKENHNNYK